MKLAQALTLLLAAPWLSLLPAMGLGAENKLTTSLTAPRLLRTEEPSSTTYKMTVSPANESKPAMKYRLVRQPLDLRAGNAAPYYYRALILMRPAFSPDDRYYDEYLTTSNNVAEELAAAEEVLKRAQDVFGELNRASSRSSCEWSFDAARLTGTDAITFLLPEVSAIRTISRLTTLRARVAMHKGDLPAAIEALQINYQTARDVAAADLTVNQIVAMAINNHGSEDLIRLISCPQAPNLYWAIAELRHNTINVVPGAKIDLLSPFRLFPFLEEVEAPGGTPELWTQRAAEVLSMMSNIDKGTVGKVDLKTRLLTTTMLASAYPNAKQRLLDDGMSASKVETMPTAQVVFIDSVRAYQELADDYEKLSYIPFTHFEKYHEDLAVRMNEATSLRRPLMRSMMITAVDSIHRSHVRMQRMLAAVQTIEAIRMHAARNGNALPTSLHEISCVPVPKNPATDRPFVYVGNSDTGTLTLPLSDGVAYSNTFELSIAK